MEEFWAYDCASMCMCDNVCKISSDVYIMTATLYLAHMTTVTMRYCCVFSWCSIQSHTHMHTHAQLHSPALSSYLLNHFSPFVFSVDVCAEYIIMSSFLVISKLDVTTCCSRYDCQDSSFHLCWSCMFTIPLSLFLVFPPPFPVHPSLGPLFTLLCSLSLPSPPHFSCFHFIYFPS